MDMEQVVEDGVPERVRLHPGDVVYVPATWIADMNVVVDQYVRGLIPALAARRRRLLALAVTW